MTTTTDLVCIANYNMAWEAHCHRLYLEQQGIEAEVYESGLKGITIGYPGFMDPSGENDARLLVFAEDAERARAYLAVAPKPADEPRIGMDLRLRYAIGAAILSSILLGMWPQSVIGVWTIYAVWLVGHTVRQRRIAE